MCRISGKSTSGVETNHIFDCMGRFIYSTCNFQWCRCSSAYVLNLVLSRNFCPVENFVLGEMGSKCKISISGPKKAYLCAKRRLLTHWRQNRRKGLAALPVWFLREGLAGSRCPSSFGAFSQNTGSIIVTKILRPQLFHYFI